MEHINRVESRRKFLPSLGGARGYAFLLVFLAHCCSTIGDFPQTWWTYPVRLLMELAWVAVPVFFVLSGYLICGVLIDTREREGYFKVFYSRRFLRVFPPYYLLLLGAALCFHLNGYTLGSQFWIHFLYIQNLFQSYVPASGLLPTTLIRHLWSMGVEEQFYVIWPLVVWICPNRRILLRVTLILIAISFALRFAAPLLNLTPPFVYFWTPTRVDAILLGAALALIRDRTIYRRLEAISQYIALGGVGAIALIGLWKGDWVLSSPIRIAILISLWNITAVGIIVSVMREGSFLYRVCSLKGICWLGARSYGLYLFHLIYLHWFFQSFVPIVARFIPFNWALLVAGICAFGLTLLLASLCYRFVEQPAGSLKKRLKYGETRKVPAMRPPPSPMLVDADS
jgi:peptidoglycan/LPS O-acetylase OafA/YrhL